MAELQLRNAADEWKPDFVALMPKQIDLVLQPKQLTIGEAFYATGPDAATWIGGGGARAGGKSGGMRRIMIDRRIQRPGTDGAIIRRVWEEVKRNHVDEFFREWPELRAYWRAGDHEIRFPNGSRIIFMYAENQQEVDRKFWGVQFYDIMVDQAEQFTERELTIIKSCNRWPNTKVGECKTGLFFNPGGIGTEFLRRVFWQKRYHNKERPTDYNFVHLFGWDNYVWFQPLGITPEELYGMPDLCGGANGDGPAYQCCRFHLFINRTGEGRKLDALPPTLRAGHLLGSFDSFAGQYFAGVWDESKLILTAPQEQNLIQPWWNRWMAHDDGVVHHAAIQWAASGKVSPKMFHDVFGVDISEAVTVVVIYRNLTENETEAGELIRQARRLMSTDEARTVSRYFLSPDAWEKDAYGHSTADSITEELTRKWPIKGSERLEWNLPPAEQADNSRINGWRFMYAMMKKTCDVLAGKMNPTREDDDFEHEGGGYSPKTPLLFISSNCMDVIESIPLAIRDDQHAGRGEDVLKMITKADDVNDCTRYLCKSMLNPRKNPFTVVAAETRFDMEQKGLSMTEVAIKMQKLAVSDKRRSQGKRSRWAR